MAPFPAEYAPKCDGHQFPKTIQEYDLQYTRVHNDRSHKRQPVAVMSLRALPGALGASSLCPICAFALFEYVYDRTQWNGLNEYATKSIREKNG